MIRCLLALALLLLASPAFGATKTILVSIACPEAIGPTGQHCEALVREQVAEDCPAEALKAEQALDWFAEFLGENEPPVACIQVEIKEQTGG